MVKPADLLDLYEIGFDVEAHRKFNTEHFVAEGDSRFFSKKSAAKGVVPFYLEHEGISRIFPHRHHFFEMVLVVRGGAMHRVGKTAMPVREGEILLLGHLKPHAYEIGSGPFGIVNICFDPALLYPETEGASLDYYENFRVLKPFFWESESSLRLNPGPSVFARLLVLCLELVDRFKNGGSSDVLRTGLLSVLQSLVRVHEKAHPVTQNENRFLEKALEILSRENSGEKISLAALSRRVGMNPFTFSRQFKKRIGSSLPAYLNRIRIQKAKNLLRETGLSVTDLALSCGFSNLSHFHRTFKEATGMTPAVYQDSVSKKDTSRARKRK